MKTRIKYYSCAKFSCNPLSFSEQRKTWKTNFKFAYHYQFRIKLIKQSVTALKCIVQICWYWIFAWSLSMTKMLFCQTLDSDNLIHNLQRNTRNIRRSLFKQLNNNCMFVFPITNQRFEDLMLWGLCVIVFSHPAVLLLLFNSTCVIKF